MVPLLLEPLLMTRSRPPLTAGQTKNYVFGPGECKVHDLQNIGSTELIFTTVEFLQSANSPLPLAETAAGTA